MCGRYSLAAREPGRLRARFPVGESVEIRPRYNVAPTDEVLAVTCDRDGRPRGELLRWGLVPGWADSPRIGARMINARMESVAEKPAFRTAFQRWRCLIIADGFYEWPRGDPSRAGARQAFHISRDDGAPFAFAGLWSIWHGPDGHAALRTCTIITRPANERIATLHDRMPVILDPADEAAWLDAATPPEALSELLRGLPAERTTLTAVGAAVNDARHDAPDCLAPPPPAAQASLF
ncbi:MAG TPA: SOS response-associated peptidase [Solirubrobacteraceae bacterium]|nr:SOS response-associated peptidase [Solirubrobacteraceae bacterium]